MALKRMDNIGIVVDDLGRETKQNIGEALCQLLEGTRASGQFTRHAVLITTNLTKAHMRERYEPRVLSRLGGCVDAFDVTGPDLRLRSGGDF